MKENRADTLRRLVEYISLYSCGCWSVPNKELSDKDFLAKYDDLYNIIFLKK